jgi:hypothetical protein
MNSLKERRPGIRETEKNALVLRLERNQKDVDRLLDKLGSYRYEPRTHGLFERRESLRNGLEDLTRTNAEIIASLREKKRLVDSYVESAKRQFAEFIVLHGSIEEYIQGAMVTQRNLERIP